MRTTDGIASGTIVGPIAATFPLERIRDGVALQAGRHAHGQVVITLWASGTAPWGSIPPRRAPHRLPSLSEVIEVRDYDPAWSDRFEALRAEYRAALEAAAVPVRSIEHVGSTSVPGLAAKPIIDIDIVVDATAVDAAASVLVGLGFEPEGELGIPQRWAFRPPARLAATNTYVIVAGSLALRNHLALRDTLRVDPDLRAEYGAVKKRVGAAAADIYEYGAGKNAVIQRVLAASGLSDEERAAINGNQVPVREHKRAPRR